MLVMLVTLEVSKLSGWLNADACCRESNGEHTVCGASWCRSGGRRQRATAAYATLKGALAADWGHRALNRARGGAHGEHVVHVSDSGGFEAKRLVER